jgi:hypothetical protein
MPRLHDEQGLKTGRIQITLGTRLIACSVLVALGQVLLWLREGQWAPFNVAELLRWAGAGHSLPVGTGVAAVAAWLLTIPISAGIAAIGFVIAWIGASKLVSANSAGAKN